MKVSLTLTIEPEVITEVNKIAKANEISTSEAISLLIKLALKNGAEIKALAGHTG